jgi:hypothetical protein
MRGDALMDPLWPPPLLDSRSPAARVVVVGVVPVAFGALCGVMLGVSEALYLVLTLPVAIAGGFLAGLEHTSPREAARRGLLGGALFGSSIVAVHAIIGNKAKADLPHPAILLAVLTAVGGMLLGALGARLRSRITGDAGRQT